VVREERNVTERDVAATNLELYNASVVVLVHSCGTSELRHAANLNYNVVIFNSSQRVFQ
jgi:hypothetical protein